MKISKENEEIVIKISLLKLANEYVIYGSELNSIEHMLDDFIAKDESISIIDCDCGEIIKSNDEWLEGYEAGCKDTTYKYNKQIRRISDFIKNYEKGEI